MLVAGRYQHCFELNNTFGGGIKTSRDSVHFDMMCVFKGFGGGREGRLRKQKNKRNVFEVMCLCLISGHHVEIQERKDRKDLRTRSDAK